MLDFAEWIRVSDLNNALENSAYWIVPTAQTIHILSIAIVVSSMIMVNGRIIRAGFINQSIPQAARRFVPWVWVALGVLLLTGVILIIIEPVRTLGTWVFWFKMGALLLAALMTLGLQRDLLRRPDFWSGKKIPPIIGWFAGFNILLWVLIVFAGRWIAYS